jgi:hypothetical protein
MKTPQPINLSATPALAGSNPGRCCAQRRHHEWVVATLALLISSATAGELTTAILDAGGVLTSGGDVAIAGSLGGFGGVSSDNGPVTARAGFPGQIYDPASVAVTPAAATVNENDTRSFTAEVVCDDDTLLPGSVISWFVDSPFLAVSAAGEVTAGLLPESFTALLTATVSGVSGTALVTVTDPDPDNYGEYAGDGLPDGWQALYFGYRSVEAGPAADPDADGQDNRTEWLAGTAPADPNSLLRLAFSDVPSDPGTATLFFSPYLPDRIYILESSSGPDAPWTPLPATPDNAPAPGVGLIMDTLPAEARRFYRLRVEMR